MIEQIRPNLFRLLIPLPNSPLRTMNSYLIKGHDRSLLVDTGMNRPECLEAIRSSLARLEVDMAKTDILLTHFHIDHSGLAGELATATSRIYCSKADAAILTAIMNDQEKRLDEHSDFYVANGFPKEEYRTIFAKNSGYRFAKGQELSFTLLADGDRLEIGDYSFTVILTPGHSPGHICLYEEDSRVLLSGDHVLFDISPNIVSYREMENSLKAYLASLDRIKALAVDIVLPGHRHSSSQLGPRIEELQQHHLRRLEEIRTVLEDGPCTAWQVAARLTWGLNLTSWQSFPAMQKWFALGETIAHLKYLAADRQVAELVEDGLIIYAIQ